MTYTYNPEADTQLTRDDLKTMNRNEIVDATRAGRCDLILGRRKDA